MEIHWKYVLKPLKIKFSEETVKYWRNIKQNALKECSKGFVFKIIEQVYEVIMDVIKYNNLLEIIILNLKMTNYVYTIEKGIHCKIDRLTFTFNFPISPTSGM